MVFNISIIFNKEFQALPKKSLPTSKLDIIFLLRLKQYVSALSRRFGSRFFATSQA
jgi:hypothetical protein